ncbi:S-methyl-5-thioribose-1-phosphate isomerase [Aquibaculum arenosum]|uniref:Methylthioribose-1-phosphate isomerase n=1 Tax=Aquibaculum arenosum TaxID=3032591 RepID=A0ABT5YPW3_9PROT|nr:S-methyl-5-thioribose-1-phosphate isomerase [Fodinicurvata sp. CAU 1616]MDF2096922.1 S-methyl-5-thioribose-1-phosphate isomerase [Fodinicurvata sp. CAU 1616]
MKVDGRHYRTIWSERDDRVQVIDQTRLPHAFEVLTLEDLEAAAQAIERMVVRGAPLIGATAAYGLALGLRRDASDDGLEGGYARLLRTRPTAVNLRWALDALRSTVAPLPVDERAEAAWQHAARLCDEDVELCRRIGEAGLPLFRAAAEAKSSGEPLRVLTHCNAGWLATVDWGTALAPIYMAHDAGIPVEVWVDETRPRNQGAALTAWELGRHGVPHKVIADNAGGHLMQQGLVDLCIVGTDRTTANGDVCNKIGTYLKALAAKANGVPFYVALPYPTIDWQVERGRDIPIEERSSREVTHIWGRDEEGRIREVQVTPDGSAAANPAFDVTPAELVTAFITDRGVCPANRAGLAGLYRQAEAGQ